MGSWLQITSSQAGDVSHFVDLGLKLLLTPLSDTANRRAAKEGELYAQIHCMLKGACSDHDVLGLCS